MGQHITTVTTDTVEVLWCLNVCLNVRAVDVCLWPLVRSFIIHLILRAKPGGIHTASGGSHTGTSLEAEDLIAPGTPIQFDIMLPASEFQDQNRAGGRLADNSSRMFACEDMFVGDEQEQHICGCYQFPESWAHSAYTSSRKLNAS